MPEGPDDDLKNLGRRSWIEETLEKPQEPKGDGVVTGYTPLPHSSVKELRHLVAENPSDGDLKDMLAFVLYSNGRLDEAIEVFKDLIAMGHNLANQHLYLGNCFYRKGLIQMALLEWEKVLTTATDDSYRQRARSRIQRAKAGVSITFEG